MEDIYNVTNTSIIHELLDNEVIIANLDSGIYYSIQETGVTVWQLLLSNQNVNQITHQFAERYALDFQVTAEILQSFVNQLQAEGLLVATSIPSVIEPVAASTILWPPVYQSPKIEKYEEMKDLLMLDPIHEVDEQGWPSKAHA